MRFEVLKRNGVACAEPSQAFLPKLIAVSASPGSKTLFQSFFYLESTFIKAGSSKTRKGLGLKMQQERAEAELLWLPGQSEKGGVGSRCRALAWMSCHGPLLPWLQLLWGLFKFRRRTPEREERHRCAPWSEIVPGVEF